MSRSATKHPDSFHAGRPPTSGEKWAFNLWFHEAPTQVGEFAAQSKLYREGKAPPSVRDLMTHIAKASLNATDRNASGGPKPPAVEPTDAEKDEVRPAPSSSQILLGPDKTFFQPSATAECWWCGS